MKENHALRFALEALPHEVSGSVKLIPYKLRIEIREILLRSGKPIILIADKGPVFLGNHGRVSKLYSSDCIVMTEEMMSDTFMNMCKDSVYSYMDNINAGFLTLPGGNRVGVCGRFVNANGGMKSVRDITSLSVRIAAEHMGIGFELLKIYKKAGLDNTLIVGPPCSGKTTLLRDICRLISEDKKVSLIDERCEISGNFDVGMNTDVYLNYNKYEAIEMSVRTMSPEVVVFDEIGKRDELELVGESMNSGVKFIFSMHADSYSELCRKPQFVCLSKLAHVKYIAFLRRDYPGKPEEVLVYDENSGNYVDFDCIAGSGSLSSKPQICKTVFAYGDEAAAS